MCPTLDAFLGAKDNTFLKRVNKSVVCSNAPLLSSFLDMASDVLPEILEASMTVGPV